MQQCSAVQILLDEGMCRRSGGRLEGRKTGTEEQDEPNARGKRGQHTGESNVNVAKRDVGSVMPTLARGGGIHDRNVQQWRRADFWVSIKVDLRGGNRFGKSTRCDAMRCDGCSR